MYYARWSTKEEMIKNLTPINLETGVQESGLPLLYDDKYMYIDTKTPSSLIIGSVGSGKTQVSILPKLKLAMMANESIVLNDPKGELCELTQEKLKEDGYKVIIINLADSKYGNNWNPLSLPYELYKKGEKDKALTEVENLGYYLFSDNRNNNDPFWENSATNYFVGLVFYLFENATEEEINFQSVQALSDAINTKGASDKFLKEIDPTSVTYISLTGTLMAPPETRGSILSVFTQKFKPYISRYELTNMLSNNDFTMEEICKEKTAVFIIEKSSTIFDRLISLFTHQLLNSLDYYGNERYMNIILEDFDRLPPIKDFAKVLSYARGYKVKLTAVIPSFTHLDYTYGKEDANLVKMCFGNTIFLVCNDYTTAEEVSKLMGKVEKNGKEVPLISSEELKKLNMFEAVVSVPRMYPYKTKLIPDYKLDWGYKLNKTNIEERINKEVKIYELNI